MSLSPAPFFDSLRSTVILSLYIKLLNLRGACYRAGAGFNGFSCFSPPLKSSPLPPPDLSSLQIELLYFRGACYHALGLIKEAVRDYDIAMAWNKVRRHVGGKAMKGRWRGGLGGRRGERERAVRHVDTAMACSKVWVCVGSRGKGEISANG